MGGGASIKFSDHAHHAGELKPRFYSLCLIALAADSLAATILLLVLMIDDRERSKGLQKSLQSKLTK